MATKPEDQISILVEARDEATQLKECFRSGQLLTQNILFIDQHSKDSSVEIATNLNVEVIQHAQINVVEEIREFGIRKIKTPWVFILDADERITADLAKEIIEKISSSGERKTHFQVPRKNIFMNRWLKHGGWYPDYQMRLIHIPSFQSWPTTIHADPIINGQSATLVQPLEHYAHGTLETMVSKTALYEEREAELLFKEKRASSTLVFFRKFLGELNRRFIKNAGFLDGIPGMIESIYQAFSKTVTYLILYEKSGSV